MIPYDIVVATFNDDHKVDAAVHKLVNAGVNMKNFSVVGRAYSSEEKMVGFYNTADRMELWGKYGAFWGGLWGLLCGGVFLVLPEIGPIVVLGHLGVLIVSAIEVMLEDSVVHGGLTALGAALFNYGVPEDSAVNYGTAVKANGFLVVAYGPEDETDRAKAILQICDPSGIELYAGV